MVIRAGRRNQGSAVRIPSSKSLSHRALIAASLSKDVSLIRDLVINNDTKATMHALECLGVRFETKNDGTLAVYGTDRITRCNREVVDCGESGSTLRFLIPLFSLCEGNVTFTGHGKLMERPQTVYETIFQNQGLLFRQEKERLIIQGPLKPGTFHVRGDISSQFISGLLFVLPLLKKTSTIVIREPYESRSYVGLTEDVMELAGIPIKDEGNTITVPDGAAYQRIDMTVDGDDSQGVFFAQLAMTSKQPVTVYGIRHDSRQGDHVFLSLFEKVGGTVIPLEGGYRFEPGKQNGFEANLSDCPDLGPSLFALASCCEEESVFTGCGRLRIKESDRIETMKTELEKLGASVQASGDVVRIKGCRSLYTDAVLEGHNDHRVVMALAALAPACENTITIHGAEAVSKSYPNFFEDLKTAGVEVEQL